MAIQYLTVASAQGVSSAFLMERGDRALAIQVPSVAAHGWVVQFALVPQGVFLDYYPSAEAGSAPQPRYCVYSGNLGGWGVIPFPPTGIFRIAAVNSIYGAAHSVSITTTLTVVELMRT